MVADFLASGFLSVLTASHSAFASVGVLVRVDCVSFGKSGSVSMQCCPLRARGVCCPEHHRESHLAVARAADRRRQANGPPLFRVLRGAAASSFDHRTDSTGRFSPCRPSTLSFVPCLVRSLSMRPGLPACRKSEGPLHSTLLFVRARCRASPRHPTLPASVGDSRRLVILDLPFSLLLLPRLP